MKTYAWFPGVVVTRQKSCCIIATVYRVVKAIYQIIVVLAASRHYALVMVSKKSREEMARAVGLRIRTLRVAAGFTQEALAEKADIAPEYLSRLETARQVPSLHVLVDLAKALGIDPATVLAEPRQEAQAERMVRVAAMFSPLSEEESAFIESQLAVWIGQLRKRPR